MPANKDISRQAGEVAFEGYKALSSAQDSATKKIKDAAKKTTDVAKATKCRVQCGKKGRPFESITPSGGCKCGMSIKNQAYKVTAEASKVALKAKTKIHQAANDAVYEARKVKCRR